MLSLYSWVALSRFTNSLIFLQSLRPSYSDSLTGSDNLKYNEKKAKELWDKANAISPWTADDKLTFAYNADGDVYKRQSHDLP